MNRCSLNRTNRTGRTNIWQETNVITHTKRPMRHSWQIVLTRMHEGDRREVCIPAKWAYGSMKMGDIPAHSTLIFEMELVKIER